jgi:hypothetical protein
MIQDRERQAVARDESVSNSQSVPQPPEAPSALLGGAADFAARPRPTDDARRGYVV